MYINPVTVPKEQRLGLALQNIEVCLEKLKTAQNQETTTRWNNNLMFNKNIVTLLS